MRSTQDDDRRGKGMLILTRKIGEKIAIGDSVIIEVQSIEPGKVTLGFQAPRELSIYRQEVLDGMDRVRCVGCGALFRCRPQARPPTCPLCGFNPDDILTKTGS